MQPQMVIIIENTLTAMALRSLLQDMVPGVDIICYNSMESFRNASSLRMVHYFVSPTILFRHSEELQPHLRRTIVVSEGDAPTFTQSGLRVIDATASEQHIARQIIEIHQAGHPSGHNAHPVYMECRSRVESMASTVQLSPRERDVLAYVVKGFINKEIAEALNISLATVVFHRNNISEKLKTRSIGRLTIYAVLNNIVSLSDI